MIPIDAFIFGFFFGAIPAAGITYFFTLVRRGDSNNLFKEAIELQVEKSMKRSMDKLFASEQVPVKLPELPNA